MRNRLTHTRQACDVAGPPTAARSPGQRLRLSPYVVTVLVLWTLVGAMLVVFSLRQDSRHLFTGVVGSGLNSWVAYDSELYLDMIEQSQHGAWLFENRFGPEMGAPRYLNSIWLVIGKLSGPLGLSPTAAFTIFRFLTILLFVLALRRMLAETVGRPTAQRLALFLIAFGGGLGWLFYVLGQRAPGLTMFFFEGRKSEPGCFLPLLISPHLALAMALMLWAFAGLAASSRRSRGASCWTPLAVLALATFHPYDVVAVGAVGGVYTALLWVRDGRPNLPLLRTYLLALLVSAPVPAYHSWSLGLAPDLQGLNVQNAQPPADSIQYIAAVLPLGILAAYQLMIRVAGYKRATSGQFLVAAWMLALPIMTYAYPAIPFARKLAIGMIVPVYILAAEWIERRTRRGRAKGRTRVWMRSRGGPVLAAAIAVSFMSSGLTLAAISRAALARSEPYFLSAADYRAMRWLAGQPGRSDVVVSANVHGVFIPRIADKRPLLGHQVQTVDYLSKERFAQSLVADRKLRPETLQELSRCRAKWVFYGHAEREWWKNLRPSRHLQLAYDNGEVQIFRIASGP